MAPSIRSNGYRRSFLALLLDQMRDGRGMLLASRDYVLLIARCVWETPLHVSCLFYLLSCMCLEHLSSEELGASVTPLHVHVLYPL